MASSDHDKPVNFIAVLCDPRRVQRIAITCRCSLRWIEFIPGELHDSDLIARFTCPRCDTEYDLHHKQLHRVIKENASHDRPRQGFATVTINDDKQQYDS